MPSHYNYSLDEQTLTYRFTTKNGIDYSVAFSVDYTLDTLTTDEDGISNVYQIVIDKISTQKEPFDSLLSKTIDRIIGDFFINAQNSIIYICADDDNRAMIRFMAFDRWHKNSILIHSIVKVDNVIQYRTENYALKYYTSFLYHCQNPDKERLMATYKNIEDILNSDKP